MTDTNLTSTSNSDNNKSIDSFRNESSGSITNFNDFIFKPVINLAPNNSGKYKINIKGVPRKSD